MKNYDTKAGALFDSLRRQYSLHSDAALAEMLKMHPPVISKMRSGSLPVGATCILAIHERLGLAVADIRAAIAP